MPSYAYAVLFCSHFFLKFDNDTAASLLLMSAFFLSEILHHCGSWAHLKWVTEVLLHICRK